MFIAVRSYDNYIPAHMMLSRLEDEGIKAYLQDEHTVTIDPILSNAIGGIKLMIYSEQLERAMSLIQGYEEIYKKSAPCPVCHSTNVLYITQPKNPRNWIAALVSWFGGSYAVGVKNVYHCYDCSNEFENI